MERARPVIEPVGLWNIFSQRLVLTGRNYCKEGDHKADLLRITQTLKQRGCPCAFHVMEWRYLNGSAG